jgi:hypothetical protein
MELFCLLVAHHQATVSLRHADTRVHVSKNRHHDMHENAERLRPHQYLITND